MLAVLTHIYFSDTCSAYAHIFWHYNVHHLAMWLPLHSQHATMGAGWEESASSISHMRSSASKQHVQEARDDGWSLPQLTSTFSSAPSPAGPGWTPLEDPRPILSACCVWNCCGVPLRSHLSPPLGAALLLLLPGCKAEASPWERMLWILVKTTTLLPSVLAMELFFITLHI